MTWKRPKEKQSAADRARWAADDGSLRAAHKAYYEANKDRVNEQKRGYYARNRERLAAARARWLEKNRHVIRELNARRKKLIARATPKWADHAKIRAVYAEADRLTRETGVAHHVDHIYPLQGKTVCGLHVAENLRPIPARANIAKKNRLPDDREIMIAA